MGNNFPTIELLETTHQFPGRYVVKVIGKTDDDFVGRVVSAVQAAMSASIPPPHRIRETTGGRHVSITFEPVMKTPHEVLAVYQSISEITGLVMLL